MEASPSNNFYEQKLAHPGSVEALAWLQGQENILRTFGGNGIRKGFIGKRAVSFVERLYRHGAKKVTAIAVERHQAEWVRKEAIERGLPETDVIEATDVLIVELPESVEARENLIQQWVNTFGRKKWDVPAADDGQPYLFFGWD